MGPNRCDLYLKNGTWFELTYDEFDRIDALMNVFMGNGVDSWVNAVGVSGGRVRFLLSQIESMEECTISSRENKRDIERLYRSEKGWEEDD